MTQSGFQKETNQPLEAGKPGALDRQNEYLQKVLRYPASKLHFFDESSVVKTTGKSQIVGVRSYFNWVRSFNFVGDASQEERANGSASLMGHNTVVGRN